MSRLIWFDGWTGPLRVLVFGTCGYLAVAALIRLSGKRTLGKFNAFDWVGTVAIGSTLANLILSDTPLAEGIVALALLVLLQFLFSYVAMRWPRMRSALRADPTVLVRHGQLDAAAARRERVTDEEILSAIRAQGGRRTEDADLVILEPDGSLHAVVRH